MNMNKIFVLGLFLISMLALSVNAMPYEADNKDHVACATELGIDDAVDGKDIPESEFGACVIKKYIFRVIGNIQMIAGAIAALAATIVGFMFINAKDPSDKKNLGDKLKAIIVGLGIVLLSVPLVQLLI